jgi:hypothetical protein
MRQMHPRVRSGSDVGPAPSLPIKPVSAVGSVPVQNANIVTDLDRRTSNYILCFTFSEVDHDHG